uniref:Uncharacterized protein n=1 Tax=Ditylenchus dipsaci TaxID=166011 RepID=A0A915ESL6_9BILA
MGNEHTSMRLVERDRHLTTSRDFFHDRLDYLNNDLSKRRFSVDVTKAESKRQLNKPSSDQHSYSSSAESGRINAFKQPRHKARAQSSSQLLHNNLSYSTTEKSAASSQKRPLSPAVQEPLVGGRHRRMSVDDSAVHHRTIAAVVVDNETSGSSLPQRRYSRTTGKSSVSGVELQGGHRRYSRPLNQHADGFSPSAMDGGLCLAEQLKLSSYQTLTLQQTWPRIKSTVFSSVFRQLTQKNAVAKELFQKMSIVGGFSASKCCDQKEHVQLLVELFDASIQS